MRQAGLIVLLALAPACASAAALPDSRPAQGGTLTQSLAAEVRLVTLKNGMQLLLAPDSASAAVDVAVWFRSGSAYERQGITGISHLFEHLMFRGSEHYGAGEHERLVAAEGGSANAYTAPDYACYHQTIPPGALELVFRLEADRIGSLRLTAESVAAEKRAVRDEKRWRAQSEPGARLLQRLNRLAWTGHPYRWPVIGLDEDLEHITLADCRRYFADHCAPGNALVTVVGGFDPDEALAAAKRWLEPLKRRNVPSAAPAAEPAQKTGQRSVERMDVPFPMLLVGWKIPGRGDPDTPALALLARILAVGPAARLQRALVSGPGKCLSVQGGLDGRRDAGLLYVLAGVRPGSDSTEVERVLFEEVEKLARDPVGDDELDRARHQEEINTLLAWQTPHGRAEALGTGLLLEGDYRAAALRLERLRQLTAADLQRAAARIFGAAGRNVLWIMPEKQPGLPGEESGGSGGNRPGFGSPPSEGGR